MKANLIDLTLQCCDADNYLSLGYRCAKTNFCYDELRPIGDALWFSLPYRLGLDDQCLLYIQVALSLLVSFSLFILFRKTKAIIFTLLALVAVMLQLWPTFFNTLADTPASLLLIEGLLLTLIARQHQKAWLYFAAGIFLGCSALLRAAYFNPLCAAGVVFFISWLWQTQIKKRSDLRASILIFSFTLPMTLQFYATWKNMHQWSFVSRDQIHAQLDDHLNSAVAGYDTLLIESSYYWSPPCRPAKGVWTGIKEKNFPGLYCLLTNRIYFYFGSYAPHTFYGKDNKNFISNGFAEEVGNVQTWSLHNMQSQTRSVISPLGDNRASHLQPKPVANETNGYVQSSSVLPLESGSYRYSIWLWSAKSSSPTSVTIQSFSKTLSEQTQDWDYQPIAEEKIELPDKPQQFFIDIKTSTLGYITTRIGSTEKDFYAWGAMLENNNTSTGYIRSQQRLYSLMGSSTEASGHERIFSTLLLIFNLLAVTVSFIYLFVLCRRTQSPIYIFIGTVLLLILVEALLILPEQRFLQAALAAYWILFLMFIHGLANRNSAGGNT